MTERLRGGSCTNSANLSAKMANDLTPRKTMLILVIVVGCFAVLWPKVFHPMLVGSANQHIKPSPIDKTTGCCDVISETDVNTIKIMSELCSSIIKRDEDAPLTGKELVARCQSAVLETCGIDISAVLQEQVRLGQSFKQILDEVRSLNGSLCLKYNFGLAPWRLGVPHRVTVKVSPSFSIRQERPLHLRSELVHPAFQERGRAIPQRQTVTPSRPAPRIVEGRPGPIPGMRPTLGGAGHVVPPPKQGSGSMGLIMPIYTVGIVIFFTYTVMKVVFKKQPEALYPPVEPDTHFRKEVFESERAQVGPKLTREGVSSKLVVNAMSALLDEVDHEIETRRKASDVAEQDVVANGKVVKPHEEEQPTVRVLGMETTASCEGGQRWSRPESPVQPPAPPAEPVEPPQEIFLEGSLPAQSHLLVADSATEAQKATSEEDPAVVLAGKMTLSVISLDSSENGTDESSNSGGGRKLEGSSSNISEEFEKIEADVRLEDQIDGEPHTVSLGPRSEEFDLLQEIENDIKEINSKNQPMEIENVEDQIISKYLGEIGKGFAEQEQFEIVQQQLEKGIDEIGTKTTDVEPPKVDSEIIRRQIEDAVLQPEELTFDKVESKEETVEKEIVKEPSTIISTQREEAVPQPEQLTLDQIESKEETVEKEPSAIISSVEELVPKEVVADETNADIGTEKAAPVEAEPLEIAEEIAKIQEAQIDQELAVTKQTDIDVAAVDGNISETDKIELPTPTLVEESNNVTEKMAPVEEPVASQVVEAIEKVDDELQETDLAQRQKTAEEKDAFTRLNEAIAALHSEFRKTDEEEPVEGVEAGDESPAADPEEEDEEIEYEYEVSEDEGVGEDERNVDRIDGLADDASVVRLNGEQSKYGTTSSATLAENDISDEENLGNEDEDEEEEVEEIIEYVTDDEEEEEEDVQPGARNNVNHVNDAR